MNYIITEDQMEQIVDLIDALCSDKCTGCFDGETGELSVKRYGSTTFTLVVDRQVVG